MLKIEKDAEMTEFASRLLNTRMETLVMMTAMTKGAERAGVKDVQAMMMRTIYLLPGPPDYTRTRDLYNAVREGGVQVGTFDVKGSVYIAHEGKLAQFYYAAVMEKGTDSWFWWGRPATRVFPGRHFMFYAQLLTRVSFRSLGVKGRNLLIRQIAHGGVNLNSLV